MGAVHDEAALRIVGGARRGTVRAGLRARQASAASSRPAALCDAVFSILESVAFDTGYAGSNGLEPQSWVNGNGTSYIYFGSGEFDGQGSGHDFSGTVSSCCKARGCCFPVAAGCSRPAICSQAHPLLRACKSLSCFCPRLTMHFCCSSTCPPPATSTRATAAARTPTATTASSKFSSLPSVR